MVGPQITERVQAGAAFLDEHLPGWWRSDARRPIDPARIALDSPTCCLLGQLASGREDSYYPICQWLRLTTEEAEALGFLTPYVWPRVHPDVRPLNEAWRALIEERRAVEGGRMVTD